MFRMFGKFIGKNIFLINYVFKNKCIHFFLSNFQGRETKLEMLNIGYNCLLDASANAIQTPLKNNKNLVRLGLQSTQITCKGAQNLAEALETNTSLQVSYIFIYNI